MRKILLLFVILGASYRQAKATPILSFFNEMKTPALVKLFEDSTLVPTLQQLHAEIRMGMLDLTPERAAIVHTLNKAGIPVVAWLLLPEEKGYWFHSGNGAVANERYLEVKKWIGDNQLQIKGIGLDLEIDINDLNLLKASPRKMFRKIPGRLYDKKTLADGREEYAKLISQIKADGYAVESYYVPFIRDEANNNRTALQQVTKFMDIRTDHDIPMLYSSFMGDGDGLIQVYGFDQQVKYYALGSTGGGFDTTFPTLSYNQLVHDMNIASKQALELHIFSLEGCVEKGYLSRLVSHSYDSSLVVNQKQVAEVKKLQKNVQSISNILSYPTILFGTIAIIFGLFIWLIVVIIRAIFNLIAPEKLI